jgi:hypothetical protein
VGGRPPAALPDNPPVVGFRADLSFHAPSMIAQQNAKGGGFRSCAGRGSASASRRMQPSVRFMVVEVGDKSLQGAPGKP